MDLTSLLGAFMGDDALTSIGTASDTSASDVASVLSAALPSLIAGANAQAYNEETAESFANALNQHSKDDVNDIMAKVLEAVSVGITDGLRGETLKAYVVLRPGEEMTKSEVIAWCRQKLANYKVPRLVEFREELPKTISGKIQRNLL